MTPIFSRLRAWPAGLAAVAALLLALAPHPAAALIEIDINKGNVSPLPIAIPAFVGQAGDAQLGADVAAVITNDLQHSGLFQPLDPKTFTARTVDPNQTPSFPDWTVIAAQALVVGGVARQPDGRVRVDYHLWDVFAGQHMVGQQLLAPPERLRQVAHKIADSIYERLTGEKGYFNTRIVFVDETGPKDNRVKRLAIMDQDGANVRYLTRGTDIEITPRFNPSAQEITYMSIPVPKAGGDGQLGQPRVYLMNVGEDARGQREPVGDFPGMTFAPRFSPDGQKIIMSLQVETNTNIFTLDLRSKRTTRLTSDAAIDTSPSYSPDGSQIVFESDRGGQPQLYVMNADGSNAHRISFGKGSYGTPVWSPRGDLIAFTRRAGGQFAIGVIKPDGSGERILTEGFHNEGPTWAPNGRVIMFFRNTPGANGGPQLWTIDLTGYGEYRVPTPSFASDPAWSPLLN